MARFIFFLLISTLSTNAYSQSVKRKTYFDAEKTVIKEEFFVYDTIRNHLDGSYTSYYLSGNIKSIGDYGFNKATGIWEYFYENGTLKSTGSFFQGKTFGIWEYFYESGSKRSEGILDDNVKGGHWIYYYENGNTKSEGEYVEGQKHDVWTYYFEEGGVKAKADFHNGSGIYKEYYVSGDLKMEGLNHLGKSDSLWTYYYQSGEKMAEGYYDDGIKTGTWKYYYKNGELSAEGGFETGNTVGNWIYYYESGAKSSEGIKKNGMKDGYWKMFYETGETKGVGELDEGTGEYKEYYTSGKLKVTGFFKDGLNDGHWTYYDEEGHVEGIADFNRGKGNYEGYYLDGSTKMSGKIENGRRVGEWILYDHDGEVAGKYHPVYPAENSLWEHEKEVTPSRKINYDKPDYRYKNKRSRFFTPVVNEYKGVIIGGNPIFSLLGFLPLSLEFYLQERQGFELEYIHHRSPFYNNHADIGQGSLYHEGSQFSLKQKFYYPDERYGMLYFGHQIGYRHLDYEALPDASVGQDIIRASETNYFYGVIIGDRLTQSPKNAGLTLDMYLGVGIGRRDYKKNYNDSTFDQYFSDINKSSIYVPVLFGINIGYLGFKKYRTSPVPSRK